MSSVCFVLGTRPEIIKLAPLIRRARERGLPFTIIHTGQHYDYALDGIFFGELGLPTPDANLAAAAPTVDDMLRAMRPGVQAAWAGGKPSVVVVQGDTNSALAGAVVAQEADVPVAHVEAGLRSDDFTMPEEHNRIRIDGLAERLYVPTAEQAARLAQDGIPPDRVLVTGNTILDAVNDHLPLAATAELPPALEGITARPFAIVTLHRPALVDDPEKLGRHLRLIDALLASEGLAGVFPCHPRTRVKLHGAEASFAALSTVDPVGYLPMLRLLRSARIVITDSGGLQEEASILRVPCVTVRENTERPETIRAGGNVLVGFDPAALEAGVRRFLRERVDWKPLYDVDSPSNAILDDLERRYLP